MVYETFWLAYTISIAIYVALLIDNIITTKNWDSNIQFPPTPTTDYLINLGFNDNGGFQLT